MTRALAVCAGFSSNGKSDPFDEPADAERIAIADQLTDSGRLRHDGKWLTNCSAAPYRMPTPLQLGCPADSGTTSVMPQTGRHHFSRFTLLPKWKPAEGCFTSRFGPYSSEFHFPDSASLANLRAWAYGEKKELRGEARFSFGGFFSSPWSADCHARRAEVINTGDIKAGSLEAFGIYLHTLGDFYSHQVCRENWGARQNPPWYTHTIPMSPVGCGFVEHAREFGCPSEPSHNSILMPGPRAVFVTHTRDAALNEYDEMLRYAAARGIVPRLSNTPENRAWLTANVWRFTTGWSFLGGAEDRRRFANRIADACASLREGGVNELPDISREEGELACPAR